MRRRREDVVTAGYTLQKGGKWFVHDLMSDRIMPFEESPFYRSLRGQDLDAEGQREEQSEACETHADEREKLAAQVTRT